MNYAKYEHCLRDRLKEIETERELILRVLSSLTPPAPADATEPRATADDRGKAVWSEERRRAQSRRMKAWHRKSH